MSKIYIVKSSCGDYDEYGHWNEKAFVHKEDAEAYAKELDAQHRYKPRFITTQFEDSINECRNLLPAWGSDPYKDDPEKHIEWLEKRIENDINTLYKLMCERGIFMTPEMYEQYIDWENRMYEKYRDCEIEELEIT